MNEIAIQAQIISDDACQFIVDRAVADGSMYFDGIDSAQGSPLAEKLFEIKNVDGVLISNNVVKISKLGFEPWMPIAKQVGTLIREQIQSGVPAISDEMFAQLPGEDVIREKVQKLLQVEINPSVESHGGFVSLADVRKNDVYLVLGGGCQGCGMANQTLRSGIEKLIRVHIPEVGAIIDVTDHQSGTNPYYRSN
ncbi:MAG: NifU family protein [Ignavibacteriae bacterium]|nr:NifU family protein [Ignavibacteriota bacterium]